MRPSVILLLFALSLSAGGCCSVARFFCGADRTPWVSVDYATPELAVKTLLEALRRDEPEIVYLSLSDDYRNRLGLDAAVVSLAWTKLREQNPGLHVAGYAEVPAATHHDADHATIELSIEGRALTVDVVRQLKREVRFRRPNGTPAEPGQRLTTLVGIAEVAADDTDEVSTVRLVPWTFRHDGLDSVPLAAIEFVGIEQQWKIDRLRLAAAP